MQFPAEQADPENAGLEKARALLAPLVARYKSQLSTADLYVLAAYVALECADGPCVRAAKDRRFHHVGQWFRQQLWWQGLRAVQGHDQQL